MLELKQHENFAIGNSESLKRLETLETANVLVVSDSHGSPLLLKTILYSFGKECDAICFCGDGTPDLAEIFEESTHDPELLEKLPDCVFIVRGNGDNSSVTLLTSERIVFQVPVETTLKIAGRSIFMTHGHNYNVYYGTRDLAKAAVQNDSDLVFYGHTHIANMQTKTLQGKKVIIMNPGSCSLPRGGMPHTFAVLTLTKEKITCKYHEIKWDSNGEVDFKDYEAPTGEIKLIW